MVVSSMFTSSPDPQNRNTKRIREGFFEQGLSRLHISQEPFLTHKNRLVMGHDFGTCQKCS